MTHHEIIVGNSNHIPKIKDKSVQLIITSPPYPMIEMWDMIFAEQDPRIQGDIKQAKGLDAFYKMHALLNQTWEECDRVLADNGFICINIGDATRTIGEQFQLYSNHTQVINFFLSKQYSVLPDIHWRKQSNAPNKFMGSGMYAAGAYVTYEHEYILIFRKGGKRTFAGEEKLKRQKSAYFWEERNEWFSDLWDIKGTSQIIHSPNSARQRNASFPFEIPYRLINMYSVEGDTILDPFAGLGTTNLACMASNRNSIGVEIDESIAKIAMDNINVSPDTLNQVINNRIQNHINFINSLPEEKQKLCYTNIPQGFKVKTKQETAIKIEHIISVQTNNNALICNYG